jgi:hypothetical protein
MTCLKYSYTLLNDGKALLADFMVVRTLECAYLN